MNQLVKRFLVLAVPLLIFSGPEAGYSIQVENQTGLELGAFSLTGPNNQFHFGDLAESAQIGLGNADLQFGPQLPRQLQVAFKPKHGNQVIQREIEMPLIGRGESVKLAICSKLDLIERLQE